MKFTFEADMYKGQCSHCPCHYNDMADNDRCGVDEAMTSGWVEELDCPLKEANEVVWHPYSEEKPTQSGYYLVTLNMFGKIFVNVHPSNGSFDVPVIAWAELPKPYKE